MTVPFSLGIDLGTTSLKVLALTKDGDVLAASSSHHGIDNLVSGVQADPEMWWSSLVTALGALSRRVCLADVCAIGLSGNMSSVVLVNADGESVAPALLLADSRGSEQLKALTEDQCSEIRNATGNEPETVFSLSSLLWWSATSPQTLRRATAWLSAKDYLRARLTGVLATDPTDAHNSLLMAEGRWNSELIESLGLPIRLFPALLKSTEVAGSVHAIAATETKVPQGTPVATGSGDVAAALTGMGGLPTDALAISLGTSATVMAAIDHCPRKSQTENKMAGLTLHPTAEGAWFALGSLLTGGLALNWLRSIAGAAAIKAASSQPNPRDQLIFLPYLAGTGSPDFVPSATGTILGITPSTTASHLVSALCEAVAFDIARLIDRTGPSAYTHVLLSGGGSRVEAWPQILADVLRIPVAVLDEPDLSAVGAAIYGWAAVGTRVTPRAVGRRTEPQAHNEVAWESRRNRFETARALMVDGGRDSENRKAAR